MKLKYSDSTNNIVNFSNSLLAHFGVKPFHPTIPAIDKILEGHDRVVVLLFDGMGTALLNNHLPKGAILRRNIAHTMTATFPPTTVASTNGLLSAKYPIENGWLGWAQYFDEHQTNIDLFTGRHNITKNPIVSGNDIRLQLDYQEIISLIEAQNPQMLVTSIWPSIKPGGAENIEQYFMMLDQTISQPKPKFVYGYWTAPDMDAHDYGVNHPKITKVIRDINDRVETLVKKHVATLFLVIADHGLIDIEFIKEDENQKLYSMLERPFSNEPRAANFYVKKGKERAFAKLFNKLYGQYFILKSHKQIIEEQWYGEGTPHPLTEKFIGTYLAIATDKYSFDHAVEGRLAHHDMKAHHAGLTEDEMSIDIVALNRSKK